MRRSVVTLLFVIVLAGGSLGWTLVTDKSPALGLDLQGGASVVLRPDRSVSQGILNQSIAIIRNRVDALGVAEPDISRQGTAIVVQLPGVKDQTRALDIVGQTAELRFRPVLSQLPPEPGKASSDATTTTTSTSTTSTTMGGTTTTAAAGAAATSTTLAPTTTVAPTTTTSTTVPDVPSTPPEKDIATEQVVLPELDKDGNQVIRYVLGPAELTGKIVKTAKAVPPTGAEGWQVSINFTSSGSTAFDALAAKTVGKQLAIVLDGVVKSAPVVQQASFGGQASISGQNTGEKEAKDLALVLRYGALPVQLKPETVQKVSATLGKDSLQAGMVAGMVGLALVLLYMLVYYRGLGLVVVLGLGVSAALLWSIVCYLSENSGLALSLAGATGIIVSVGVTVDSYVVYFERLKDEIRSGKTIRSSVDRGFTRAYRTILAADISSLIGAFLLYFLTVGPVRGFAFFLGLSTLMDLFVAFFFTRPIVALLGRSRFFTEARWVGVARGLAARPTGSAA